MKRSLFAALLPFLCLSPAFAVPQVKDLAVDSADRLVLELLCDAEPVQAVALETRAGDGATWQNVGLWNWQGAAAPGTTVRFMAPLGDADAQDCRVLFFGERGLLKVETFRLESTESEPVLTLR